MLRFESTQRSLFWLKMASFSLFLGRGWQFLFHSQQLAFWLENPLFIQIIGFALLIGAAAIWIPSISDSKLNSYLLLLAFPLLLMSLASWESKDFMLAQLMEMTGQWITPIIFWMTLKGFDSSLIKRSLQISIALIFIGHGLYAANIYPRPDHFYEMTQTILGVSAVAAGTFLLIAGLLDLVVGIGIFYRRTASALLLYAVFWGFLTAMARPVVYIEWNSFASILKGLHEWAPAMVYRLPHSLLPLVLFYRGIEEK